MVNHILDPSLTLLNLLLIIWFYIVGWCF